MSGGHGFDELLDRWTAAGLIRTEQADAIRAFEAGTPSPAATAPPAAAPPAAIEGRSSLAIEAIAYAGAVVALAGVVLAYQTQYAVLGPAGRIGVVAVVTVAALAAALLLGTRVTQPPLRRARAAALTLVVVAVGQLAAQVQIELAATLGSDATRTTLVAALSAAVVAAAFLAWAGNGLLALAMAVSLIVATSAFAVLRRLSPGTLGWEAPYVVTGALLVAAAELNRRPGRIWAAEILALVGVATPVLLAYTDSQLGVQLAAGAVSAAAFLASVMRASLGYAIAGGVGLFGLVLDIELRYFANSLGFALTLIISGLALLAIAFLVARLLPRLRPVRVGG